MKETISRAKHHEFELNVPTNYIIVERLPSEPPWKDKQMKNRMIAQMKPNLTSDQILHSLNTQELLIVTYGSCSPNPGSGGCVIVLYPPNNQPRQDFDFPICGIT